MPWNPTARYRPTPYGREWSFVNELVRRTAAVQLELRIGRAPAVTPWGTGVRARDLAAIGDWRLSGSLEVWRQPDLLNTLGSSISGETTRLGAQLAGRLEKPLLPFWRGIARTAVVLEVGVKSGGFVPGQPYVAGSWPGPAWGCPSVLTRADGVRTSRVGNELRRSRGCPHGEDH